MKKYRKRQVKEWIVPVLISLALFIILRFVLFVGIVPTDSMEPTIKQWSLVLGNRWYQELQKEDVIVFRMDDRYVVKRIAAVPGDSVCIKGQHVKVPESSYYVLGDNPKTSYDSRYYEDPFVKAVNVVAVIW